MVRDVASYSDSCERFVLLCTYCSPSCSYNPFEQMFGGKNPLVAQSPYDAQLSDELSISPCDIMKLRSGTWMSSGLSSGQ